MLYKKKIIFHNLFNINYISRFSGKLPSDKSSIVLIRDSDKCRDCSFNSLAGLECQRWSVSGKNKHIRQGTSSLYSMCMSLSSYKNKSKLKYRIKSIL